ncbi:MAG: TonB family protein [bacterium]|nr:TonB family protein [bacterium]
MRASLRLGFALLLLALPTAAEQRLPVPLADNPRPVYPEIAFEKSIDGGVKFIAVVDVEGRVERLDIVEVPHDGVGFEEAVRVAVSAWRFEPALREGEPVAASYRGIINFVATHADHAGRMYPVSSSVLWTELRAVLRELGLSARTRDKKNGVLITRSKSIGRRTLPGFQPPDGSLVLLESELHVFVPPWAEPGRLYLGSMNVTENRQSGRAGRGFTYNLGAVESWLLDRLDQHLGVRGRLIPRNAPARLRLANELQPGSVPEACLQRVGTAQTGPDLSLPETIESSRIDPLYPASGAASRQTARIIVGTQIQEDGWAGRLEVVRSDSRNPEFGVSAIHTVSFWRYRPAVSNGCPVPVDFTVFVQFKMR